MDVPSTLVIVLVGATVIGWLAGARDGGALDAFGLGFLGYRSNGWPRGVQEEDSVHFSLDGPRHTPRDEGIPARDDEEAELIELDRRPEEVIRLRRLR